MTDRRRNILVLALVATLLVLALADIMPERVDNLGVSEPEIQRSGENQIEVSLPDVKNADQAQQQVGTTAQLAFYDWEKSVIGPNGKPNPSDTGVTGGQGAGSPGNGASQS